MTAKDLDLEKLQEKWAKIKAVCLKWAGVVEELDDRRCRLKDNLTPKTNWTIKVEEADAVTDCLLDMAEELERKEKELTFNYSRHCKCGELVTIVPTECNGNG